MHEKTSNLNYNNALNYISDGKIIEGIQEFSNILASQYHDIEILFEYDSIKENKTPNKLDTKWIHLGNQDPEISGNILRLISLGTTDSLYQRTLPLISDGIFIDFVMSRGGGGAENCYLSIDCNLGSEILRINKNSVNLASNSSIYAINSNHYHSFRLIIENGKEVIAIDGKPILVSRPSPSLQTNKIVFGSTISDPPADVESLWPLIRVGIGKNLINNLISSSLSESLFYSAENSFNPENNSQCVRELNNSLMINPLNTKSLHLLESVMDQIHLRDPAFYMIDDVLTMINNPRLDNLWATKKKTFNREKIIEVKNVGVKFNVYGNTGTFSGLWNSFFSRKRKAEKFFWALKDINFEIQKGEIVGIIGKNGSGKSTLLRVIANILEPDEGFAKVNGKSVLLYPGMVFREEISGRENIYLGCLFMGMKRREIDKEFDAIVDFAELQNDIHRTYKYYSDGMKSRLSFSVATHIKHDILLLDELLGAGDISFNEKAANRMQELVTESKSSVIVTHSTQFVRDHCTRAAYIEQSKLKYFGDPNKAVDMYLMDSKLG